ncbi:HTH-type transcriptional regulator sgrR [Serratia fonticola]|uniref:HTH-type transcriptional regulator sgrR n=1 Tax=Serratia fonticola TaxID=47917 RepID=A0A4U9U0T6_SERFO|nr:HTH-type transcriptional regulator sgrR [Serratia fonticola]
MTLTFYSEHSEFHAIKQAIASLLAEQGIKLNVQVVDYEAWHKGKAQSDLWLGSANFTLPLEFSLFATLYELPLIQHCLTEDIAQDAAQWRENSLSMAEFLPAPGQQPSVASVIPPLAATAWSTQHAWGSDEYSRLVRF